MQVKNGIRLFSKYYVFFNYFVICGTPQSVLYSYIFLQAVDMFLWLLSKLAPRNPLLSLGDVFYIRVFMCHWWLEGFSVHYQYDFLSTYNPIISVYWKKLIEESFCIYDISLNDKPKIVAQMQHFCKWYWMNNNWSVKMINLFPLVVFWYCSKEMLFLIPVSSGSFRSVFLIILK